MTVCSSNIITEHDIERAIIGLLDEQERRLIVPAPVYQTPGKYEKCCGCFPNVSQIIVRTTEQYHLQKRDPAWIASNIVE